MVGTTWLSRGAPYWARRLGTAAVLLFVVLLEAAFLVILGQMIWTGMESPANRPPLLALSALVGLVIVGTGAYTWHRVDRAPEGEPSPPGLRQAGEAGAAGGVVVRFLGGVGGALLFLGVALTFGPLLVLFLRLTFARELPVERRARARLERLRTG